MSTDRDAQDSQLNLPLPVTLALVACMAFLLLSTVIAAHRRNPFDDAFERVSWLWQAQAHPTLWLLMGYVNRGFLWPVSTFSTSTVALLVALKRPEWRKNANIMTAVAVAIFVLTVTLPQAFGRTGPDGSAGSYPNMLVACAVAFYGFLVIGAWRSRLSAVYTSAIGFFVFVVGYAMFSALYFGLYWPTDVIGGVLLGCTLLAVAYWLAQ